MPRPVRTLDFSKENESPDIPKTSGAISVLGRFVRIAVALPLLALSCWVLLPFAIVPVSSVATTNARLSRVRTTVAGQVLRYNVEVGDRIGAGQTLVEIASASSGGRTTAEKLSKEEAEAEAHQTALNAQIAETEKRLRDYDKRVRDYDNKVRESTTRASLELELDRETLRMESTLSGLRQVYGEAYPEVRRMNSELAAIKSRRASLAQTSGTLSGSASGIQEHKTAAKQADARTTEVERPGSQLSSPPAGDFPGPDVDDQPVERLRDEAAALLSRLRQEKVILELRQRALSEQLDSAASSVDAAVAIKSSVDGIVWSRDIPAGQTVKLSDDLIRIVETNLIQVEGYIDARYAQRVSIGDRALIYLPSENKRLSGRLTVIQGPGQRNAGEDFAIDLKAPADGLYRVVVQLDPAERGAATVGQVAKISFPGPDSSLMSKVYSLLSRF